MPNPFLLSLSRSLSAYAPTDAREQAFQERMLALLDTEAPTERGQYVPGHFTASAFVLSPARDALLLIHHAKLGIWVQPGGHIEAADADALAAARREVEEEVGLGALLAPSRELFDLDIHPIPARGDSPKHEHFDLRFSFVAQDLAHEASDEVLAARWVPFAELPGLGCDESVLRAARKLARS